jgi:glycosyltransferase involved in cell wall biosynthesis
VTAVKVAFDSTPLAGIRTGIGRSVEGMLESLVATPDSVRVWPYLLGWQRLDESARALVATTGRRPRRLPVPMRYLMASWATRELPPLGPLGGGADVVHATAFVAAPTRRPTLITVHDCAFALHPDRVAAAVVTFDPLLRRAVARGAHLHTTTEQVGDEVCDLLGVDLRAQQRLHVVPFGVPAVRHAPDPPPADAPYVLALGTIEPRKNLPTLVRAFALACEQIPELRLVLAGPPGPDSDRVAAQIASSGHPERVRLTGRVDDATRDRLLAGATVLAYPSVYEGFGFPVLEAMTLRTAVLAADIPALREVARDGATFADPHDPAALAAGIVALVSDDAARQAQVEAGARVAAGYTWGATAAGLTAAYRRLATCR